MPLLPCWPNVSRYRKSPSDDASSGHANRYDAFVLWGANMAEMHPILWTRLTDHRLSADHVKVAVLSVFEHRCFDLADIPAVFEPQTDLVILN